jgi:hypothetical protein
LQRASNFAAPIPAQLRAIVGEWFNGWAMKAMEAGLVGPPAHRKALLANLEADAGELADPTDLNVMAGTHGAAMRLARVHGLAVAPGSDVCTHLQELARVALLEGGQPRYMARSSRLGTWRTIPGSLTRVLQSADKPSRNRSIFARLIELHEGKP